MKSFVHGDPFAAKRADRPPQRRRCCGAPFGDELRETIEQQIGRMRSVRWWGRGPGGPRDVEQIAAARQTTCEECCAPSVEVGLARQARVERLEPPGRLQQLRRSPGPGGGRRDLPAQQIHPGALELVRHPRLRCGQQLESCIERPRVQAGLRGCQRAVHASRRVTRQRDRAPQESGRRGQPAARPRASGRPLELEGDLLVGCRCRCGEVPGTTVLVYLGVRHLRERPVYRPALAERRRSIDRRAHQRMQERHAFADHQQPLGLVRSRGREPDAESLGRAPHEQRVVDGLRRSDQQEQTRLLGERLESPQEALLDPPGQRVRPCQPERARQLRRRQPPRQLEDRQRVASRLRDEPVADALIETARDDRRQQGARVVLREPCEPELGQPQQLAPADRVAHAEHDRHRLGQQPSRDESENLPRGAIEPLGVIDKTQQRPLRGNLGQQAERGQGDQEAVRSRTGRQSQRDAQSGLLRLVEARRAGPAAARRADAVRRTATPSRTRRRRSSRRGNRMPAVRSSARAPSCRRPPRRGGPGPRSGRRGRSPTAGRATRARRLGPATPAHGARPSANPKRPGMASPGIHWCDRRRSRRGLLRVANRPSGGRHRRLARSRSRRRAGAREPGLRRCGGLPTRPG